MRADTELDVEASVPADVACVGGALAHSVIN